MAFFFAICYTVHKFIQTVVADKRKEIELGAKALSALPKFAGKTKNGGFIMDIPGLSMAMAASQTNSAFGVAMLSKSLDAMAVVGNQITDMMDSAAMERSVNPSVGANFDMYV